VRYGVSIQKEEKMGTMRNWTIATSLFGALLMGTTSSAGAGVDLVAGAGKGGFLTPGGVFPAQYHVQATNHPVAGETRGHVFVRIHAPLGEIDVEGEVLCLVVSGETAVYQSVITASSSPLIPVGFGAFSVVVDNGQGANDPPDQAGAVLTAPPGPTPACAPVPFIPLLPVDQGNFVVQDAS
jgi:hypothetical protein